METKTNRKHFQQAVWRLVMMVAIATSTYSVICMDGGVQPGANPVLAADTKSARSQASSAAGTTDDATSDLAGSPSMRKFQSHGKSIRTEWYAANVAHTPKSPKCTVLILPGSGGIEPQGGFYRELAKCLAKAGATIVIVHYMDRDSLTEADNAQMSAHFGDWMQTIHDAISFAQKQPGGGDTKISLLGHSLGAQLALHESATDPRVDSVLDMAGCFVLPTKSIIRMPKVLILHGRADTVVPLVRERQLVAVLKRTGSQYSEHLFPRVDHVFNGITMNELCDLMVKFLGLQTKMQSHQEASGTAKIPDMAAAARNLRILWSMLPLP